MEDRRTTAIELDVSADADRLLQETVAQFEYCANATAEWCWADDGGHTVTRIADAERRLFRRFRRETALPPNLVQQAVRRGVEAVKSSVARLNDGERVGRPGFASGLAVYDERDADLDREGASLATTDGRASCDFVHSTNVEETLDRLADERCEFRGGHLECRDGDWYLHASTVRVDASALESDGEHGTALGVEVGEENVAVASDGTFWSTDGLANGCVAPAGDSQSPTGSGVKSMDSAVENETNGAVEEANSAVEKGTNEYGRAELYLHRVGNELVTAAVEHGCSHIVFEDVTHDSEAGTGASATTSKLLRQYVEYRAAEHGVEVARVTSESAAHRCSTCGFEHEDNHDGERFECLECGFQNHAAYNASRNIGASYRRRQQNATETNANAAKQ
ncbi:transposase [Halobacterium zhouii]|uniref:transposase n=1 Tax=Halobacterium zhouii TaxID=2902624 RepID=UPI001E2EBBC8|nr:transposase [Halobacterium zhouii]